MKSKAWGDGGVKRRETPASRGEREQENREETNINGSVTVDREICRCRDLSRENSWSVPGMLYACDGTTSTKLASCNSCLLSGFSSSQNSRYCIRVQLERGKRTLIIKGLKKLEEWLWLYIISLEWIIYIIPNNIIVIIQPCVRHIDVGSNFRYIFIPSPSLILSGIYYLLLFFANFLVDF